VGRPAEMKGSLSEHGFTGEKGLCYLAGNAQSPLMMLIGTVGEGHQKARIGDGLHLAEKPLRSERFLGPEMEPARRINDWPWEDRALSSSWRINLPFGTPDLRAVSSSHLARSSGRRIEIVLPICLDCRTRVLLGGAGGLDGDGRNVLVFHELIESRNVFGEDDVEFFQLAVDTGVDVLEDLLLLGGGPGVSALDGA
jgi:hypothetical protein